MTRRLSALIILLILAGLLAPIHAATYSDPWPLAYSNWQYRRPITINNPNSNDLTDFQVKITLDSSFDFSKANSDGSDIRFADAAGNTIQYYIESWDSTNRQAVVWIKVPNIPASGSTTVYMYYGNPSATSESNGDAVFDFFDDFETTKMTNGYTQGLTLNGDGTATFDGGGEHHEVWGRDIIMGDIIIEMKGKATEGNSVTSILGVSLVAGAENRGYEFVIDERSDQDDMQIRKNNDYTNKLAVGSSKGVVQAGKWYIWRVVWLRGGAMQYSIEENGHLVETISATDTTYTSANVGIHAYQRGTVDWIRVRKYAAQEPTARIGTEELNNPVTVTFHFLDDAGNALDGVTVLVDGIQYTLNDGDSVVLVDGTHTFEAQKQHYVSVQKTLDVESDITLTLVLNRQSYTVYFYAYDENNRSIDGFNVYANAHNLGIFNSGDSATLKYGTYIFRFKKEHYKSILMTKIIDGNGVIVNFTNVQLDNVNKITLYFYDMLNNLELNNVTIWIDSQEKTLNTGATIILREGTHKLVFEKQGYLPRGMTLNITEDMTLVIYFVLANQNHTVQLTNNFTMPDINGTGWSGWQIGKEALSLNFDKAIQLFFTENPNSQAQAFLPFAIWIGMTILGLVFSQSPLVALTLGVITQASLAGLGAKVDMRLLPGVVTLYLFLFIWILKDFIESRKAD